MPRATSKPACLDIRSWRVPTRAELAAYARNFGRKSARGSQRPRRLGSEPSLLLIIRKRLSPVDVYCYLKCRFGEPNGVQNVLRRDDSDNWIHWDFILKAGRRDVYLCGTSREIHILVSEALTDRQWLELIDAFKADYSRVAKEKGAVRSSLEKWIVFPNKFAKIAEVCAQLHENIINNRRQTIAHQPASSKTRQAVRDSISQYKRASRRAAKLYASCLELSLLTPVLAEAFINMAILILCKKDIRNNQRQFDGFIRSQIDTKVFDLFDKCEGFARRIDPKSTSFVAFKRIMDKRNHAIHGNVDPERERIETVFFDRRRPLFEEAGDHLQKFFDTLEDQNSPSTALSDYEEMYVFFGEILACLRPDLRDGVWRVMQDNYPGYDVKRQITGAILPDAVLSILLQGARYDDELVESQTPRTQHPASN